MTAMMGVRRHVTLGGGGRDQSRNAFNTAWPAGVYNKVFKASVMDKSCLPNARSDNSISLEDYLVCV